MDPSFKSSDDVLEQLVADRRDEVVRLQQAQADGLKDLESRGQARLEDLRKSLPKDIVEVLDRLDKGHADAAKATDRRLEKVKEEFVDSAPRPENKTAFHRVWPAASSWPPAPLAGFHPTTGRSTGPMAPSSGRATTRATSTCGSRATGAAPDLRDGRL